MRNYIVNHDVTKDMCVGFYNSSALTLEGLSLESLPDYADYLDKACGLKDDIVLKRFEFGGRWFCDVIDNLKADVVKSLYE